MKLFPMMLMLAVTLSAGTATVDKIRVHYDEAGKGPATIVLIHGWTCDGTFWKDQQPTLSKDFRVVTVDLPGHGRSDKPQVEYTLDLMARGVLAAMDSTRVSRAVLIGHSMGTSVARQVVELAPKRVSGLVSVDGSVFRIESPDAVARFQAFADSMRELEPRRKMIEGMFRESTTPELRAFITKGMLAPPDYVAVSAMKNSVMSDVWSRPATAIPVLAINRRAADDRGATLHKQVFTNLDFRELDGVSHFLHMEKPAEVNRLIIEFVKKVGQ